MANLTDRHGSPLLSLTTRRPPDSRRGIDVVHLDLQLPQAIASEVLLAETGARAPLDPREAAHMLWSSPVAQYLDGRVDGWQEVPGLDSLVAGRDALLALDRQAWPSGQAALRTFVAKAAPGVTTWPSLSNVLADARVVERLNDLVLIFKYAAIGHRRPLRTVAELYRLARALTGTTDPPASREAVISWLQAPLVAPTALVSPSGPTGPRPPEPEPAPAGPPSSAVELRADVLERLELEISNLGDRSRANEIRRALRDVGVRDSRTVASVLSASRQIVERPRPEIIRTELYGASVLFDRAEVQSRVARQRRELAARIADALPARLRQKLGTAGVALEDLTVWPDLVQAIEPTPSYLQPVGRSDLLLVRQTTTGYRRAEIAYIENILIGETRSREHTNRVLSRQELFESTTQESEETRDLQVTDRAELSREVSNVVKEDLRAEGSVEVTSRGPTKVVASAKVSYERATEEAAKSAEEYSRETIERAVKRTMERVTREARSLFEQENTEVNRHAFKRDGNAQKHVSGVYQYLERVSRAKIFWYGERELYDLLIPEPASLIWHLATSRSELHIPIDEPDEALFSSLTVANIASKREEVIRAFRVTDLPPLPAETLDAPMPIRAEGSGDGAKHADAKELQIPSGYAVSSALFVLSAEIENAPFSNGGVVVGTDVHLWGFSTMPGNKGQTSHEFAFWPPLSGTVAVAFNADNFTSLSGAVTLRLQLTDAAREAWALDAYGRVSERYEQLRREYAQAVIQATANQLAGSVSLPEGARSQLNQIVRGEIQRACVDVMRNLPVNYDLLGEFGYANSDGTLGSHPSIDLAALRGADPEVRFLQQAFEWEHLGWILYPYFWGRRSEWSRTVIVSHPDPDFAAFLNAGAARVQIPVRPGFEDLVKHFMETGEVYEGDGLPKMGDPGYVPFIDEQMTSLGAPGDEVPWPPDAPREWDVLTPTSLVLVRGAQEPLPAWDPKTGSEL